MILSGKTVLVSTKLLSFYNRFESFNMALSEEYGILMESAITENRRVLEENRQLREEIVSCNRQQRELLNELTRKVEELTRNGGGTARRRTRSAVGVKVPKLCSVSLDLIYYL